MLYKSLTSNAASLSGLGTSAHETGSILPYDSNRLRHYTDTGKRRRRPADTRPIRLEICHELAKLETVRTAKVRDTGILFIARIRTTTGRMVTRRAYNLGNLRGMLIEALA